MKELAVLTYNGKEYSLPVITGSEGEKAIDISKLRSTSGLITLDPGFVNTGSCLSEITFVDGEKGILRYRGIPIEEIAENGSFIETAFLLIYGYLPNHEELTQFTLLLNNTEGSHNEFKRCCYDYSKNIHPMRALSSMVNSLESHSSSFLKTNECTGTADSNHKEMINRQISHLLSQILRISTVPFRMSNGYDVIPPREDLSYCENFLYMMFHSEKRPYTVIPEVARALEIFWLLHADHEQNCSTSAVRFVGSAHVHLYTAISAGIAALGGRLHGGANEAVIEMLMQIDEKNVTYKDIIKRAKDKNDPFRLMGFGHRLYKTYDPRALIMKKVCDRLFEVLNIDDPLLVLAKELEEATLNDSYFVERNLYPNIDYYSGLILRAIGIPSNMFTVMFTIGRLPGWIAQWKESMKDPKCRIARPRQVYTGNQKSCYVAMKDRNDTAITKDCR